MVSFCRDEESCLLKGPILRRIMGPFAFALFWYQILWLSDDATPTTPSPRPSASGSQMGQGGLVPELSLGTSGSAKPTPARPQQTSPDPEFATEVKKKKKNFKAICCTSQLLMQTLPAAFPSPRLTNRGCCASIWWRPRT